MRIILLAALLFSCKEQTVKDWVSVNAELEYREPTKAAVKIVNGFVGCDFLHFRYKYSDIRVKSDDGEPCGLGFHPAIEDGHSAGAYRCSSGKYEVLISLPGNIHTQVCIIAHELGHTLGLEDGGNGIMNQRVCPDFIRLTDAESGFLRAKHCK